MTDRTKEWREIVCREQAIHSPNVSSSSSSSTGKVGISPFVLRAASVMARISEMHTVVKQAESLYIGYHCHIKAMRATLMPEKERVSLDQNIAMFIAKCASDVHEFGMHTEGASGEHQKEIIKFLIEVCKITYDSSIFLVGILEEQTI